MYIRILHSREAPIFLIGLFVLFALYCAWQPIAVWHSQPDPVAPRAVTPIQIDVPDNVAAYHLFGEYRGANIVEAKVTALPLVLQGVAVGMVEGDGSRALIAAPNAPVMVYRVGDTVPGGAVIKQIMRDRVILDNHGHLESLQLPVPPTLELITGAH